MTRRRPSAPRLALAAVLSAVVVPATTGGSARAATAALGGSAVLTVTTYDYCGPGAQRRAAGQATYQLPAQIDVAAPRAGENNPFSFFLAAGAAGGAGSLEVHSSAVVAAPSGSLLLTYWQLSTDGTNVSGVLIDPHIAEAAAANLFNEQRPLIPCRPELGQLPPWPGPLAAGTRLRGWIANGHADLTLAGATTDGLAEIVLRFAG